MMLKRTTHRAGVALIVVAMVVMLASCGEDGGNGGSSDQSKVFKIGFPGDFSSFFAGYDTPVRDGLQFGIDEINAAGGVEGTTLELTATDNKGETPVAIQLTQELISNGMQYMVGTTATSYVAVAKLAAESEIPVDTGDNTAPNLVVDAGDWSFQYVISDNLTAAALANYCYTDQGYRKAYLIGSPDYPYTAHHPLYFEDVFTKLGGEVVGRSEFKLGAEDFSAQVNKIKQMEDDIDVIYQPMFMPDEPVFMRQLRAAGVKTPVVGTDGSDNPELIPAGGKALEGMVFGTFAFPTPGSRLEEFYQAYEEKTGSRPDTVLYALGYDTAYIIKAALEQTKGEGGAALRDAIANLSAIELSTTDDFVMNPETRFAKRTVALVEVRGGEFQFVKDLPYPDYVPDPR